LLQRFAEVGLPCFNRHGVRIEEFTHRLPGWLADRITSRVEQLRFRRLF
jgi:hypothetical protein